ncbi:hypothetical protein OIO90_002666 [Microbotryomycetes sp. JL221]|nr:hypothetical protein OIO90_002666 [Microbotryomycetes sp. JL221]
MSAEQIIALVRAKAPSANPFLAVAATIHSRVYLPMPDSFVIALRALHGIYGLQTVMVLLSLGIRAWRNKADIWMFRRRETSRGNYIVPHFAIAWQSAMLVSLVVMQPYVAMTIDRTNGKEWPAYLAGRTLAYIPAWLATWFALWSLTVAVALPKVGHRQRQPFWTTPTFLNVHFIGLAIFGIIAISIPTYFASTRHDVAMQNMALFRSGAMRNAPLYGSMSPQEVDLSLAQLAVPLQIMLDHLDSFLPSFRIAWGLWCLVIIYTWGFFVMIATTYFRYLKRSMNRVANMEGQQSEQRRLRTAWKFTVMTAVLVTMTGIAYVFASLLTFAFPHMALKTVSGLQVITMLSLYGEGLFGSLVCALGLAQVLWGSQKDATTTNSMTGNHQLSQRGRSVLTGGNGTNGHLTKSMSGVGSQDDVEATRVHVQVQTRTMVESEPNHTSIVQFERDDYSKSDFEKDEKM